MAFLIFIALFLLVLMLILLYNELLKTKNVLVSLQFELNKLNKIIYCANSDCDCEKAYEYKKCISDYKTQFEINRKKYLTNYNKYIVLFKFFAIVADKLNINNPDEFKIIY